MLKNPENLSNRTLPLVGIIEALPNGLIMVDGSGRILLCNAEIEEMFGYSKDELSGQLIEMLIPERFKRSHPEFVQAFFRSPQKRAMGAGRDLFGLHKSGRELPIEIGLNPLEAEHGIFVLASVVDISKRRAAEEKFQIVFESSPNAQIMVDISQCVVHVNKQTEKMFGYSRQELAGQKIDNLIPSRFRENHHLHVSAFFHEPLSRPMGAGRDLFGRRKDGSEIPIEIGLSPLKVDGQMLVLATVVDITERKKIEQAIHQKNQEMEQFVYIVSHDLKSPIVTSMSFIEFIREDLPPMIDESILDSLNRLERANRRMAQLIDDLLRLSRIGRIELKLESVNVLELVQDVWVDLDESTKVDGVILDIQQPLPLALIDKFRFRQLFENLIANALKYGTSNPGPRITVGASESESEWRFFVGDNGSGIAPEYHKRIFALFERLETEKEGTGVGLAIVARVAELHGGKAWVESRSGEGAVFWVTVPKALLRT